MTHCVGNFENALFAEQRFNLVSNNNIAFFKRFDCKIFAWNQYSINQMHSIERQKQKKNIDRDKKKTYRMEMRGSKLRAKCFESFTSFLVLWQYDFAEMTSAQYAKQSKLVNREASKLYGWLLTLLYFECIVFVL